LREGAEGQRGKNLVFELSPAPLPPCTSAGFERCGEKSGWSI